MEALAAMPRYEAYKDSGIKWLEKIPSHWKVERSQWLFSLRRERARKGDQQLTASQKHGMISQAEFMAIEERRVTQVEFNPEILKHVEANDFIISMRSFQGGIEYCNVSGCVSSAYVPLIPRKYVYPNYFKYLFKSARYIEALQSTSNLVRDGQALRYENFRMVALPVVPFEEQAAIANFLDQKTAQIDEAIAIKEKQIELLKERKQIIIQKAVTQGLDPNVPMKDSGVDWIGEIPNSWDVLSLTKYSTRVDYRGKTPEKVDDGRFLLTAKNIKEGKINYEISKEYIKEKQYEKVMSRGKPQINDLLFTTEAPLGSTALVDDTSVAIAQRVILFRLADSLHSGYVNMYMQTPFFQEELQKLGTGSTALGIKASKLALLKLIAPPKKEQQEIYNFAKSTTNKTDTAINEQLQQVQLLKEYKTTLINSAVTGKIKVPSGEAVSASA